MERFIEKQQQQVQPVSAIITRPSKTLKIESKAEVYLVGGYLEKITKVSK